MKISVKVKTNSKSNSITLINENQLKVYIKAPPIKGKANQALRKFLSKKLNLAKSLIEIKKGLTSSNKILEIDIDQHNWQKFLRNLPKQKSLC